MFGEQKELSNLELIQKAERCVDKLELEKAVSLFDEGVRRFPNDALILDQYTELLLQIGNQEKARQVSATNLSLEPIYLEL